MTRNVRRYRLFIGANMSNRRLMEEVLHDLLPDLQTLHAATKSERLKIRIEQYVERILKALEGDDP